MLFNFLILQGFEVADNALICGINSTLLFLLISCPLYIPGADMIPTKITFRLKSDEAKQLYYQSREQDMSAHQMARNIVIEGLSLSRIEEEIRLLAQTIEELREGQILMQQGVQGTKTGLVDALGVLIAKQEAVTQDEAIDWLNKRFKTRGLS